MRIVREVYSPPARADEVEYTINLKQSGLLYFTPTASEPYISRDRRGWPDEAWKKNIRRVWSIIGLEPPKHFASLGARVVGVPAETLSAYGPVVLVMDPERIKDDTYIVNGDFKDIGYKLQRGAGNDTLKWFHASSPNLALELQALADNTHPCQLRRLLSKYFEARIRRPLLPQDVLTAYIPRELDVPKDVIDQLKAGMI